MTPNFSPFKGNFVFGAKAIDDDDGENSRIVYRLKGTDAHRFVIDPNNGVIRAAKELNDKNMYTVYVLASDCGAEPQNVTTELQIYLWQQELFPSFRSNINTKFTLPEDIPEGKVIIKLSAFASKNGENGTLLYDMAGGNIGDALRIDSLTGEVRSDALCLQSIGIF